jgi:Mg-chelatase subunit ChlD
MKTPWRKALCAVLVSVALSVYVPASADELDSALDSEEQSQTATAITIIFDNSGSMRERDKLAQAKRAFVKWIASLPESYQVGLIHFKDGAGVLAVPIAGEERTAVVKTVQGLVGYGRTPICDCLRLAEAEIARRRSSHSPYERHVVVVFTDGAETVDRRLNKGVVQDVTKLRGKSVEIVGIGFDGEGGYMKDDVTRYFEAADEKQLLSGLSQVDAEISDDGGIELSKADLAAMKRLRYVAPPAPSGK